MQPSIPVSSLLNNPSSNSMDPVAHAERQVEITLDDLVQTGALQESNRMDIESLLNPAGESQVLMETSDREIYQAVMDAINARENVEINGRDDVDNDIPLKPRPTRCDILKAISTIGRYVDDLNELIACKMEAVLGVIQQATPPQWDQDHEKQCFDWLFPKTVDLSLKLWVLAYFSNEYEA